jgi:hypothetical protein
VTSQKGFSLDEANMLSKNRTSNCAFHQFLSLSNISGASLLALLLFVYRWLAIVICHVGLANFCDVAQT